MLFKQPMESFSSLQWLGQVQWHRLSMLALTSTLLVAPTTVAVRPATASPLLVSQNPQNAWDCAVQMARLVNANQELTGWIIQLDVFNKPVTSYANVVYQLFAKKGDRWVQVYNTTGARLLKGSAGNMIVPAEVIQLSDIRRVLGNDVDLTAMEWKAVALIRYDVAGMRDQQLQWEMVRNYSAIATSTTTQLVSSRSTVVQTTQRTQTTQTTQTSGQTSTQTTNRTTTVTSSGSRSSCDLAYVTPAVANKPDPHRGHFFLRVAQSRVTVPDVVVRLSLMSRRSEGFLRESLIGDFRYRMNQRARFIRGLNAGDRVIVRLFNLKNQLLGYSEFELLPNHSAVTLVLSDDPVRLPMVRTVYGLDVDQNGEIEFNRGFYDYFTLVKRDKKRGNEVVRFLAMPKKKTNLALFQVQGLPNVSRNALYSCSFQKGDFALMNRALPVFTPGLAPALVAMPGEITQVTTISSTTTFYEVTSQILRYREVGMTQGTVANFVQDRAVVEFKDQDDDDDD